jgi:broad specificity polyphosphatase/5'/3'-nucleotidase SurE
METYTNINGDECVIVTNDDGTSWSGLKSAYDAMQADEATTI